jgi:hypothetical protein
MAVTVFFVHGLLNQMWVADKTLGIALGDELLLVTRGLFKGQLSWTSIEQYLLHVLIIFWNDLILYRVWSAMNISITACIFAHLKVTEFARI